jgi:hypothetical protein
MNKLSFSVKQSDRGQASNWMPERSQPNIMEVRLDATQESNWESQQQGAKQLEALTHTADAYAATSL